jgi:hypothetical protein
MANDNNQSNSIESQLDGIGLFIIFISIISAIGLIYLSQDETIKQSGSSVIYIAIGIAIFLQGIIWRIIARAGAEIIRLLKKLNDISYTGFITGEDEEIVCSECGAVVMEDAKFCPECGTNLDEADS